MRIQKLKKKKSIYIVIKDILITKLFFELRMIWENYSTSNGGWSDRFGITIIILYNIGVDMSNRKIMILLLSILIPMYSNIIHQVLNE